MGSESLDATKRKLADLVQMEETNSWSHLAMNWNKTAYDGAMYKYDDDKHSAYTNSKTAKKIGDLLNTVGSEDDKKALADYGLSMLAGKGLPQTKMTKDYLDPVGVTASTAYFSVKFRGPAKAEALLNAGGNPALLLAPGTDPQLVERAVYHAIRDNKTLDKLGPAEAQNAMNTVMRGNTLGINAAVHEGGRDISVDELRMAIRLEQQGAAFPKELFGAGKNATTAGYLGKGMGEPVTKAGLAAIAGLPDEMKAYARDQKPTPAQQADMFYMAGKADLEQKATAKNNGNVNWNDDNKNKPVTIAQLQAAGFDINARDANGQTGLMKLMLNEYPKDKNSARNLNTAQVMEDVIRDFRVAGADIRIKDKGGHDSVYHYHATVNAADGIPPTNDGATIAASRPRPNM